VKKEFFTWPHEQRLAHLDEQIATYLSNSENARSTRELAPVPLLGIPGWSADNEVAKYYDNVAYFRRGRMGGVAV
jgi:hypothetical protein